MRGPRGPYAARCWHAKAPIDGLVLFRGCGCGTPSTDAVLETKEGSQNHLLSHASEGYFVPVHMQAGPVFDSKVRACAGRAVPTSGTG